MASISVNTGNWALERAAEKYTKQTIFSIKDWTLSMQVKLSHTYVLISLDISGTYSKL